jgi:hypothetical protein
MLRGFITRAKTFFTKPNGDRVVDLVSSTYDFQKLDDFSQGVILVNSEEAMRPDLVSDRIYGDHNYYDLILKYNGISNPFSLDFGEVLLAPPFKSMEKAVVPPKVFLDRGEERARTEDKLLEPKNKKDEKRLTALRKKVKEVVPPNVNITGNQNVKVREGRVIFGEDVTQAGTNDPNLAIARERTIQQLRNNPLL